MTTDNAASVIRESDGRYVVSLDNRSFCLVVRGDQVTDAGSRSDWHLFNGHNVDADNWVEVYSTKAEAVNTATRILQRIRSEVQHNDG